ncbi:hypothetical protein EV368DRAFT_63850 [Lentinula lateritia]|uniref:Uncharacterized protein n=1 Tax=Lentinula aff. lateritia TaxID=2804960 RepID=A0ACC1UA65_9AGAR|nr:hypothetical protein F5876DRAFT_62798 [Lentinula aff. lateritia]KAJ3853724.1 hypothetical protein EV368DRAFT_63850 [Lentinula lateritia]
MADSLDCFSLCFCCFCFSICGQSETSSCRWLCPCCHSHRSKFDDDPAMNDPELDAIVERQLYEQRAAWDAANSQSKRQQHPYVPQAPAPAALPSSEKAMAIPEPMHVQPGNGPAMSEKTDLDIEERRS